MRGLLLAATVGCAPAVTDDGDKVVQPGDDTGTGDAEDVPGADLPDPSDVLFDQQDLPHFELEIPADSWDVLAAESEYNRYNWVDATFVWEGTDWPVQIRTKGENSWQSVLGKPSLKISFERGQSGSRFLGLKALTLDAMNEDESMMHERMAYLLYREAGVPAARATHATLTVNGENYGVYTNVETVNHDLIKRWFEADGGPLFEQHDVDWYRSDVPDFELEYGEDDRTALYGLADAMDASTYEGRYEDAQVWLDYDQFLRYWAVSAYVAQLDAYPYHWDDCHVFYDAGSGLINYLPHGVDESFYYPDTSVVEYTGALLGTTCLMVPECKERWIDIIWEVADVADEIDMVGQFDAIQEQIAPLIAEDTRRDHTDEYIAYYQGVMRDLLVNRRDQLAGMVGAP